MKVIGVIPVRMNSSRFPDKPMAKIHDMPMVGHCYHRTALALGKQQTYVATCDLEIYDYIRSIGGNAIMTKSTHTRATTRTAEALKLIEKQTSEKLDVVLMVQGDEPLVNPEIIYSMLDSFREKKVDIVNIMSRIVSKRSFEDENNVKVVVDCNGDALYFSRQPIPSAWKGWDGIPCYMQTGVIGFKREALINFNSMAETQLEMIESVDMNRVLEMGGSIRMVLMHGRAIGVDTPEELQEAAALLQRDSVMKKYL
jgi:3-deoxy-manno-octulosonate cytidylyltransferase (CMP-KDO synthetase)